LMFGSKNARVHPETAGVSHIAGSHAIVLVEL
jgi:hypothetical protein